MQKVVDTYQSDTNHYRFNWHLWEHIAEFIGVKSVAIQRRLGLPRQTFVRWRSSHTISVRALLMLCNTYNLRVSWFIAPCGVPFDVPSCYQLQHNPYHFVYHHDMMQQHFGSNGIPWREASRLTGHGRSALKAWCEEDATVDRLLFLLNTFRLPITSLISDSTLTDIACGEYHLRSEILELQRQVAMLKRNIMYQNEYHHELRVAETENNN